MIGNLLLILEDLLQSIYDKSIQRVELLHSAHDSFSRQCSRCFLQHGLAPKLEYVAFADNTGVYMFRRITPLPPPASTIGFLRLGTRPRSLEVVSWQSCRAPRDLVGWNGSKCWESKNTPKKDTRPKAFNNTYKHDTLYQTVV